MVIMKSKNPSRTKEDIMMSLRKRIIAGIMVVTMALSLTACGGSEKDQGESPKNQVNQEENTKGVLTVAIWDTYQEPGLTEIIKDFTEETGIQAKIQVTPWEQYWTMLEAGATGGSLPDVFWMHSNQSAKYAKYDMLLDLSDKIKNSTTIQMDKFPEELVKIYQNESGKQMAIPKDIDTIGLWYNKKSFDEAGLSYPDETWTWDTFREAAKKLTKEDGSQYGVVFNPKNNQETYYNLIYGWGGEVISEDKKTSGWNDPKSIEAMEFIGDLIQDGSMPPYNTIAENESLALFESGKVAMSTFGSWQSDLIQNEYVKENCDLAVLPKHGENRVSLYNGLGWAASANGKQTENAWKLIEYLGSEKAQKKQADLGVTMSAYEGASTGFVEKDKNFHLQAYVDMLDYIVMRPYSSDTIVWEEMSLEKLVDGWNGSKSMSEVCNEIAEEMNQDLAKEETN